MSENILEVKGLTKDYGDFVLDKLTFTVPKGVIMGLIGEMVQENQQLLTVFLMKYQRQMEILKFSERIISLKKLKSKTK